jgi:hypothetical protein
MDKKSDALLRKMLKNRVNRQRPPDNGRERLLWEAASVSRNKIDLTVLFFHPQYKSYPFSNSNDWTQTLFTWINENSLKFGIQARIS